MYTQQYGGGSHSSINGHASFDAALSFLQQLNTKELQDLMDDTTRLNKMVDDLDLVKNQEVEKETQLASNKSLAEYNLSQEPKLYACREQLAATYQQADVAQKQYLQTKQALESVSPATSLDATLDILQAEAAQAEEDSESCADAFLSRQIEGEEFIARYTELRALSHVRKVKVEKLTEILRNQEQARSFSAAQASRPAPTPPFNGALWGGQYMGAPPQGFPYLNTAVYQ